MSILQKISLTASAINILISAHVVLSMIEGRFVSFNYMYVICALMCITATEALVTSKEKKQ